MAPSDHGGVLVTNTPEATGGQYHQRRQACDQAGYEWRERCYGPVRTVHLYLLQILSFNTAMSHLRWLAKTSVKATACCRARMRLPLAVLQTLMRDSARASAQCR